MADSSFDASKKENPDHFFKYPQSEELSIKQEGDYLRIYGKKLNYNMLAAEEFTTGTVSARLKLFNNVFGLVARDGKDGFYSLALQKEKLTGTLSRKVGDKFETLKTFQFESKNLYDVELQFDGKQIGVRINGKTFVNVPDDGALKSGKAGLRGTWYSNVGLYRFGIETKTPEIAPASGLYDIAVSETEKLFTEAKGFDLDLKSRLNWNLDKAYREEDGARTKYSLNQVWQFVPVANENIRFADEKESGYIAVPSHWRGGQKNFYMHMADGKAVDDWRGVSMYYWKNPNYRSAIYFRKFNLPAGAEGKRHFLYFTEILGRAKVWLNGQEIADCELDGQHSFRKDVTGLLRENNEIEVLSSGLVRAGLFGPVWLETEPMHGFGIPEIRTVVTKKSWTLQFHQSQAPEKAQVSIRVRDAKSGEKVFEQQVPYSQKIELPWIEPKLWTPESPDLYFMDLALLDQAGKELDSKTVRFGFREFGVRGGDYMLNGKPIVLRTETRFVDMWQSDWASNNRDFVKKQFELWKSLNINCIYSSPDSRDFFYDLADEYGFMVISWTNTLRGINSNHDILNNATEKDWDTWQKQNDAEVATGRYYNHPSICAILIDIWYNMNYGATNPAWFGIHPDRDSYSAFAPDGKVIRSTEKDPHQLGIRALRRKTLERVHRMVQKSMPDTVTFTGASGFNNGIYSTHIYHTWGAPLAEVRAFFERWSLEKSMPVFIGEFGVPYVGSFFTMTDFNFSGQPYFLENGAQVLGDASYAFSAPYSMKAFHAYGKDGIHRHISEKRSTHPGNYDHQPPMLDKIGNSYFHSIFMAWRLLGVNGLGAFGYSEGSTVNHHGGYGRLPLPADYSTPDSKADVLYAGNTDWTSKFLPFGDKADIRYTRGSAVMRRVFQPVTFGIFDTGKDLLLEDHAFFGGEKFEKTVVLMNDSSTPARCDVTMRLLASNGKCLAEQRAQAETVPGERKQIPFRAALPEVAGREEFKLEVLLTFGDGKTDRDEFPFQVFPVSVPAKTQAKLSVFDPEGKLKEYLGKNNIKFDSLKNTNMLPDSGILLIGRGALAQAESLPDFKQAAAKGLNILVMEQRHDNSQELLKKRARVAFINAPAHPFFAGLKDADFSNWRGSYAIAPAYSRTVNENWSDTGNRNMVASYGFRRPAHGNYLSLLTNGFDLYQSPLLEYRTDKGCLIASQLEITERLGKDPVPTLLFNRMLSYLDRQGAVREGTALYGSKNAMEFFQKFGVAGKEVKAFSNADLKGIGTLIVADPDFDRMDSMRLELNDFLYYGGRVIYLHIGKEFRGTWLPFPADLKTVKARQALVRDAVRDFTWGFGWNNSELYWHDEVTIPVFHNFPQDFEAVDPAVLVRAPIGLGEVILCSITPETFGNTPAAGKTDRLLSALLTAAGVRIQENGTIYIGSSKAKELNIEQAEWEFAIDPRNVGLKEGWHTGSYGSGKWLKGLIADALEVRVGNGIYWEAFLRYDYNGYGWYRLTFDLPDGMEKEDSLYFIAGAIDDYDETYFNGKLIGQVGKETPNYWMAQRVYPIPAGLAKAKGNLLTVRVNDIGGNGGMYQGPVLISTQKPMSGKGWTTPYPAGSDRDYSYNPDIVRGY